MIRVPKVRVVDEEGNQAGVMSTPDALRLAQDRGYDLVEVAPMASPPVVRLLDYGQFKYEQARREKEARRHQRSVDFKEIRLKVKIGKGDFDTKVRRSIEFLEEGDRVKVTVQFRGREVSHAYLGRDLLDPLRGAGRRARCGRAAAAAGRQADVARDDLNPQTEESETRRRADGASRRASGDAGPQRAPARPVAAGPARLAAAGAPEPCG